MFERRCNLTKFEAGITYVSNTGTCRRYTYQYLVWHPVPTHVLKSANYDKTLNYGTKRQPTAVTAYMSSISPWLPLAILQRLGDNVSQEIE